MSTDTATNMLGEILGAVVEPYAPSRSVDPRFSLTNTQKILLAATAVGAYAVCRVFFGLIGLPAVPRVSSLLLMGQPAYAVLAAGFALVVITLLARPIVGRIRNEAPLFVAAIGLLALPTHGGDVRNALLDAASPTVFVRMGLEIILLAVAIACGYAVLGLFATLAKIDAPAPDIGLDRPAADTVTDRLAAVGLQAAFTLALLSLVGQSPAKGQALLGLALASGLAAWITFKTRQVVGSIWSVTGTMLAGLIAYGWSYLHPDGLPIADIRNSLSGAAYSLPLHYATAGVAGTIYGYWTARAGDAAID